MKSKERKMPCRGCLPSCKNFHTCDGRPWRFGTADPSMPKADDKPKAT